MLRAVDSPNVVDMTQFNYQHLTKELLESTMNDIFSRNRIASRRRIEEQYWQAVDLAYPMSPDESFKRKQPKIMEGNKLDIKVTDRNRSYGDSRVYRYLINGESALRFDQIPYPECCGIAIIKNFSANSDISKVDFIDAINKFIVDMQENDAFSKVLFYTNAGSNGDRLFSQIPNVIILDSFRNKRSGNILIGFEIDLLEKKYKNPEPVTSDELRGDGAILYFNEEAAPGTTLGRGLLEQIRMGGMPNYLTYRF